MTRPRILAQLPIPDYPGSELAEGGFAGVARIITFGETKEKVQLDSVGRESIQQLRLLDKI